uniref:Uncharacterized protein n=1 Tax=Sipha flava TaxID=143950 RepID=A0A2S2QY66_9HEMI
MRCRRHYDDDTCVTKLFVRHGSPSNRHAEAWSENGHVLRQRLPLRVQVVFARENSRSSRAIKRRTITTEVYPYYIYVYINKLYITAGARRAGRFPNRRYSGND